MIARGFTGRVNIIFNQKDGSPVKYDNKARVYDIPSNGLLLTQFTKNDGYINRKYFLKEDNGQLMPLKKFDADEMEKATPALKNETGIYLDGISGVYGNNIPYQEFIVSSYSGLHNYYTKGYMDSFDVKVREAIGH
ncbi:MAG: hypothetical protein BGO69_01770 [Bacteroidetes bacterium 46-16]|nr:MAG: hypothetical protein BGO69_01770 [Bacteroidetes bacterium 46-16]